MDEEVEIPDEPGWRPTWAQMLSMVERYCQGNETAPELRWLRSHAVDWLVTARYLLFRTENHIAESKRYLKEIPALEPGTGRPAREYLRAKADLDKLTARRLHWMARVKEQINEAKYIIGYDKVPMDTRAEVVDKLATLHTALVSVHGSRQQGISMVHALIHTLGGDEHALQPYWVPPGTPE